MGPGGQPRTISHIMDQVKALDGCGGGRDLSEAYPDHLPDRKLRPGEQRELLKVMEHVRKRVAAISVWVQEVERRGLSLAMAV